VEKWSFEEELWAIRPEHPSDLSGPAAVKLPSPEKGKDARLPRTMFDGMCLSVEGQHWQRSQIEMEPLKRMTSECFIFAPMT
jgi:hypothetical protein